MSRVVVKFTQGKGAHLRQFRYVLDHLGREGVVEGLDVDALGNARWSRIGSGAADWGDALAHRALHKVCLDGEAVQLGECGTLEVDLGAVEL